MSIFVNNYLFKTCIISRNEDYFPFRPTKDTKEPESKENICLNGAASEDSISEVHPTSL